MKELKTLKDLRKELKKLNNPNEEYLLGIRDFERWTKAEAVKKIKALEGDYYNLIKIFPFKILNNREVRLLIDFIKWDNNLTEEDLK